MGVMKQAFLAVAIGLTAGAGAQTSAPSVKDDLFAGTDKFAQGASSVTQIDMDPDDLGKVDGKDKLQARRTVLSVVHTYGYDKPGMYRIEDVEAFRKKLETGDWHCSVHMRETKNNQSTDVCNKRRDDGMREEAIITVEPRSLTFIHTIRKMGAPGGMSALVPMLRPEIQAEMAIARAEMQAEMATMRPELEKLRNFNGPDPEQMRRFQEDFKQFSGPNVAPDAKAAPEIK